MISTTVVIVTMTITQGLKSEDEETNDDYVSEMCGILALFGADPQANSELRAELLR